MKNKLLFKSIIFIAVFFSWNSTRAQCTHLVTHTSGIQDVNGIQVTTLSSGFVDSTTWCNDSQPHIIGFLQGTQNGGGSYTFQFSPPIEAMTLNFAAINNSNNDSEIVKIEINGSHYPIQSVGTPSSCSDSIAVITSTGDLTGTAGISGSGCNGINIAGSISEVVIQDSVVYGAPNGVIFSLFICDAIISSVSESELSNILIYPVPAHDKIKIKNLKDLGANLRLLDTFGKHHNIKTSNDGDEIIIDVSEFPVGLYFLTIETDGKIEVRKIVIE